MRITKNLRHMVGSREMDYFICLLFDSETVFPSKALTGVIDWFQREQSHLIYNFSVPGSPGKSHSFNLVLVCMIAC